MTRGFVSFPMPGPLNHTQLSYAGGIVAVIAIFAVLYRKSLPQKNGIPLPLPPGPPAHWFWSNALPAVNIAHALADSVRKYGPVVSFRQGSQVIIVIGSVQAATDIMEKEGALLVDRPRSIAAGEMLSGGMRVLMARSGDRFRRMRKALATHLQPKSAQTYQGMQRENAVTFTLDILTDPKNHQQHADRFATSIILRVAYGKSTPTSYTDPEVGRIHKILDHFQIAMRPGAHLVDRVPLLRYLPGYGKQLYQWHQEELQLFRQQLGRVKSEVEQNKAGPSFTKTLLEKTAEHRLSMDEMSYLAGTLYGAGSDTTSVAVTNTVMAAACNPLAQAKVHEELDRVVGSERAPTFEDAGCLPQLQAFLLESLRWQPVFRIGFPHRATKDIIWNGYCIPEGATVYGCHWAISRDRVAFPNPDTFDPQRWIDSEGRIRDDMRSYPFGYGRRVCPGMHLANQSLYIHLALLLWSCRIAQQPDRPIDTNAFSDVVTARALPFEVDIFPRMDLARLREILTEG